MEKIMNYYIVLIQLTFLIDIKFAFGASHNHKENTVSLPWDTMSNRTMSYQDEITNRVFQNVSIDGGGGGHCNHTVGQEFNQLTIFETSHEKKVSKCQFGFMGFRSPETSKELVMSSGAYTTQRAKQKQLEAKYKRALLDWLISYSSDSIIEESSKFTSKRYRSPLAMKLRRIPSKLARRFKRSLRQSNDKRPGSKRKYNVDDEDIIETLHYPKGYKTSSIEVYSPFSQSAYICKMCIWIEPEFARNYGLLYRKRFGTSMIIDIIRFVNWVFRPMDFNEDFSPENIGFVVEKMKIGKIPFVDNLKSKLWVRKQKIIAKRIAEILQRKFRKTKCCAYVAYVYKDIRPFHSIAFRRSLCVPGKNMAIVTGNIRNHKMGKYDIYRATVHAIGHLMGAGNDDPTDADCFDDETEAFINPFVMDPVHRMNVGLRPNSMQMSSCSQTRMAAFLASSYTSCLEVAEVSFCGNGVVEEGEECDCGSPKHCLESTQCCGMRDTLMACRIIYEIPGFTCGGAFVNEEELL